MWWYLLIPFFFFGGAELVADTLNHGAGVFGRAASGRRKNAALKTENKALRAEVGELKDRCRQTRQAMSGGTALAPDSLTVNARLIGLLEQVRMADEAYPQLPPKLAARIERELDAHDTAPE